VVSCVGSRLAAAGDSRDSRNFAGGYPIPGIDDGARTIVARFCNVAVL
jgi:hypothetical protein